MSLRALWLVRLVFTPDSGSPQPDTWSSTKARIVDVVVADIIVGRGGWVRSDDVSALVVGGPKDVPEPEPEAGLEAGEVGDSAARTSGAPTEAGDGDPSGAGSVVSVVSGEATSSVTTSWSSGSAGWSSISTAVMRILSPPTRISKVLASLEFESAVRLEMRQPLWERTICQGPLTDSS